METYTVYFSGQIIKGQDPEEVKQQIATKFKLNQKAIDSMFSGKPLALKRNVDMDEAIKYRVAFRKAGALVDIKPSNEPVKQAPQAEPDESVLGASLSQPKAYDLSDCAPNVDPLPIPDISGIKLDQAGATLDEHSAVEPPDIETEHLQLDLPGEILSDVKPADTPDINTDHLTLNPPRQGSLESFAVEPEPAKIPNSMQLELKDEHSN